jgi:hypothetical protein
VCGRPASDGASGFTSRSHGASVQATDRPRSRPCIHTGPLPGVSQGPRAHSHVPERDTRFSRGESGRVMGGIQLSSRRPCPPPSQSALWSPRPWRRERSDLSAQASADSHHASTSRCGSGGRSGSRARSPITHSWTSRLSRQSSPSRVNRPPSPSGCWARCHRSCVSACSRRGFFLRRSTLDLMLFRNPLFDVLKHLDEAALQRSETALGPFRSAPASRLLPRWGQVASGRAGASASVISWIPRSRGTPSRSPVS